MSSEVRGRCETPSYFLSICEFLPFNLWRCGRLIFFRLLFAIANNCLWLISDFENKFSVAICQRQQSTIATASLGLLKPAEVVSKIIGIIFSNFTKLPNLPKFSATLLAVYSLAQSKISWSALGFCRR